MANAASEISHKERKEHSAAWPQMNYETATRNAKNPKKKRDLFLCSLRSLWPINPRIVKRFCDIVVQRKVDKQSMLFEFFVAEIFSRKEEIESLWRRGAEKWIIDFIPFAPPRLCDSV